MVRRPLSPAVERTDVGGGCAAAASARPSRRIAAGMTRPASSSGTDWVTSESRSNSSCISSG